MDGQQGDRPVLVKDRDLDAKTTADQIDDFLEEGPFQLSDNSVISLATG